MILAVAKLSPGQVVGHRDPLVLEVVAHQTL